MSYFKSFSTQALRGITWVCVVGNVACSTLLNTTQILVKTADIVVIKYHSGPNIMVQYILVPKNPTVNSYNISFSIYQTSQLSPSVNVHAKKSPSSFREQMGNVACTEGITV